MSETVECWAVMENKGQAKPWTFTPRALKSYEVEVQIICCGVCATDVHYIDDWSFAPFPICPGHEIVGKVVKAGDTVKTLKVGDRVGIGGQRDSCGTCEYCLQGDENLCPSFVGTYASQYPDGTPTYGGYSKSIRINEKFAYKIPDNLPSEAVAPLLCAGITTYAPLKRHGVKTGTKLGVIGIGGLGHMAIKFGVALGAQVTAISSRDSKAAEAKKLGAHHFLASSNEDQFKAAFNSFDVVLCTANGHDMDLNIYFPLLKTNGKFIMVAGGEKITLNMIPFLMKQLVFCGSIIGSPAMIREMLALASEKNILAEITTFPIEKVNEALQGVREGKPLFRYVLTH